MIDPLVAEEKHGMISRETIVDVGKKRSRYNRLDEFGSRNRVVLFSVSITVIEAPLLAIVLV